MYDPSVKDEIRHDGLGRRKKYEMTLMLIRILSSYYSYTVPTYHSPLFTTISPLVLHSPLVNSNLQSEDCSLNENYPEVDVMATLVIRHSSTVPIDLTSDKLQFEFDGKITMSGGGITLESLSNMNNKPSAQAEALQRGLSTDSAASKEGGVTPTPLSPTSAGARTPRATRRGLKPEGEQLATDLNGLQVQSPVVNDQAAANTAGGLSFSALGPNPSAPRQPHHRDSSSTESSASTHPTVPAAFGSSYGPEGFPAMTNYTEDGQPMTTSDLQLTAEAAQAVALADEAIKQLNGTSSVIQGPPAAPGPIDGPFALPRGYADFVKPQSRNEHRVSPEFNVHRQSSTSSSVTEASTSSEESDLCVPRIEWVNVVTPSSPSFASAYGFQQQQQQQEKSNIKSPGRMAPPTTNAAGRKVASPRRASGDRPAANAQASLPLGATAHSPKGVGASSALPGGMDPSAPAAEDDDELTVGQGGESRSYCPSAHTDIVEKGVQPLVPNTDSPYDQAYDSKGKRRVSVDQWRAGGIPSGSEAGTENINALDDENALSGLPKKRRRSEIAMEEIDPALRDELSATAAAFSNEFSGFGEEGGMDIDKGSDAHSDSGESLDSLQDPEYKGEAAPTRGRPVRTKAAGGKKGGKAGGRASMGTAATNGVSSKAGTGKKARKTNSPNRNGGGGGGGGGSKKNKQDDAVPTANVQCEYVNPLPVSAYHQQRIHDTDFSPTTDARTSSRGNTICPDTWLVMPDEKESWCLKVVWPKTKHCYGRRSRTSQR